MPKAQQHSVHARNNIIMLGRCVQEAATAALHTIDSTFVVFVLLLPLDSACPHNGKPVSFCRYRTSSNKSSSLVEVNH